MSGTHPDGMQSFAPLLQWVLIPVALVFIFMPYAQVELLTRFQSQMLPGFVSLCQQQRSSEFRYVRIFDLNQVNRTGQIMCAFRPRSDSMVLDIEQVDGKWRSVYGQSQDDGFIWPWYF